MLPTLLYSSTVCTKKLQMGGGGREMVESNYTYYEGGRSGSRPTNERHAALSIAVLLILLICSVRYLQCAKEVMLLSARSSTRSDWIVRAGLARCGSGCAD